MRGIRRLVVYGAVTGLLTAGAVTASMEVAHANFSDLCDGSSTDSYACTLTTSSTIPDPSSISVTLSVAANEEIQVSWTVSCTDNNGPAEETGGYTNSVTTSAEDVEDLTLPVTADGQCNVTAAVSLPTAELSASGFTPNNFTAQLDYTPAAAPTASATPTSSSTASAVHPIKGYDGKCVDDNGNSSANRAKIQIWGCNGSDKAENWTFSNGEFSHNGKCLNDQGNGGSRSHVILYSCNGGSNEKWSHLANGELKLKAHNGTLCLDDPRSSTTNGTQLIVYTCQDSANQKWSLP